MGVSSFFDRFIEAARRTSSFGGNENTEDETIWLQVCFMLLLLFYVTYHIPMKKKPLFSLEQYEPKVCLRSNINISRQSLVVISHLFSLIMREKLILKLFITRCFILFLWFSISIWYECHDITFFVSHPILALSCCISALEPKGYSV